MPHIDLGSPQLYLLFVQNILYKLDNLNPNGGMIKNLDDNRTFASKYLFISTRVQITKENQSQCNDRQINKIFRKIGVDLIHK